MRTMIPVLAVMIATAAMADEPPAASGPRSGTVEAMQCLVGIRQDTSECMKMFVGSAQKVAPPWVFVSADQRFQRGRLVSSTYWGRASPSNMYDAKAMMTLPTKEMDIFAVKYAHTEYTFYISPADAEGKINALTTLLYGPHDPFQISGCSGGRLCVSGTP
jgi:hypothetical protein